MTATGRITTERITAERGGPLWAAPADLGLADLGSARIGPADLGSADLGSADLGSADLGAARIRSWRAGDEALLAEAGDQISPASLRARFLAGVPRLPEAYLRRIARLPRDTWDAAVALRGDSDTDRVVGWAEFVRPGRGAGPGIPDEADFAILVLDSWQRRGVGRALVRSLLPRAAAAGIRTLHADIDPGNDAARALLAAMVDRDRLTARFVDGLLHYTMPLDNLMRPDVPGRPGYDGRVTTAGLPHGGGRAAVGETR